MSGGFTRFFLIPITAGVLVVMLIMMSWWWGHRTADAQVALLYPTTCLGGWHNPDRVTGSPEVAGVVGAVHNEENSARLDGITTQLFCSGFEGELPVAATYAHVSVHFSWQADGPTAAVDVQTVHNEVSDTSELDTGASSTDDSVEVEVQPTTNQVEPTDQLDGRPEGEGERGVKPAYTNSQGTQDTQREEVPRPEPETQPVSTLRQWAPWFVIPAAAAAEVESTPEEAAPPVAELLAEPVTTELSGSGLVDTTTEEEVEPEETEQGSPATDLDDRSPSATAALPSGESLLPAGTTTPDTEPRDEAVVATTTTEDTQSSPPGETAETLSGAASDQLPGADPLFLVRFTADGKQWHDVGYVSEIRNDLRFELPREVLATVPDLRYLQIALVSLPRFEAPPPIWLDAIWIEVAYDLEAHDPLSPPGTVAGDLLVSEETFGEYTLVTVLRGLSLSALSHVLAQTAANSDVSDVPRGDPVPETTSLVATNTAAEGAITSTAVPVPSPEVVPHEASGSGLSAVALQALRQTPGVRQEIWLQHQPDGAWVLVAGAAMIADDPHVTMVAGNVFWIGTQGASVWRYNPLAGSYDSRTLSAGDEDSALWFYDSATEPVEIYYRADRGRLEVRSRE
jgi:hypothetical protein